jgi:hypothetical protein
LQEIGGDRHRSLFVLWWLQSALKTEHADMGGRFLMMCL